MSVAVERSVAAVLLVLLSSSCISFMHPVDVDHPHVEHPSGVEFEDVVLGIGKAARRGREVTLDYVAFLENGERIDSTYDRGVPVTFVMGQAPIKGWDRGIPGMRAGGKRRLYLPPHLAYGSEGIPGLIPPHTSLTFEIELITVTLPPEVQEQASDG